MEGEWPADCPVQKLRVFFLPLQQNKCQNDIKSYQRPVQLAWLLTLDTTGHVGLDARGAGHGQEALVVEVELRFPRDGLRLQEVGGVGTSSAGGRAGVVGR